MGNLKKLDKAGDVLKNLSIFSNVNLEKAQSFTNIFTSWQFIVGRKIAGYSRIKELDKHTLVIEADHPGIIQLLQLNYRDNLNKLNRKYPELKIYDLRILLKDPAVIYEKKTEKIVLIEDEDNYNNENNKKIDLNNIDNENFKELLFKMKKRSNGLSGRVDTR